MAMSKSLGMALMDQAPASWAERSRPLRTAALAKAVDCVQVGQRRRGDRFFADARMPPEFTS